MRYQLSQCLCSAEGYPSSLTSLMILKLVNLFIFKGWKLLTLNNLSRIYIDLDNEYKWMSVSNLCYELGDTAHRVQLLHTEVSKVRECTRVF